MSVSSMRRWRWRDRSATTALMVSVAALVCVSAWVTPAMAGSIRVPEAVGSFARASGERWGYTQSNQYGVGAVISTGARSDTKKVTRTIEYGVAANESGLKMDVVANHTVRYEVYVSGPNRGRIYRVYAPSVTYQRGSASFLYLWKLTPSLKSTIVSRYATGAGGEVYRVRHQVSLSVPRQTLIPRDRWTEALRQLAKTGTGEYDRTVTIVPDGGWGYISVGY